MKYCLHNNINWVSLEAIDVIKEEPFLWGEAQIDPGHVFKKLGTKSRTMYMLDVPITYKGKIDDMLLFDVDGSSEQNWYAVLFYVNKDTLLARSKDNAFYDIKR
ncbi:hypothetical protein ACT29H_09330 [Thermophagus sp. OGC60D27]|uniref:hypothetical protein n=1 Tax=Thermophagus sp. OGC60D27 TaxID=3458415 RepID=UPI004037D22D